MSTNAQFTKKVQDAEAHELFTQLELNEDLRENHNPDSATGERLMFEWYTIAREMARRGNLLGFQDDPRYQ